MKREELRAAVRELRLAIKGPNGNSISQTEFGRLIGKSLNSVQRYETLVAPRGSVLRTLSALATTHGQKQLAALFEDAFWDEFGDRPPDDEVGEPNGPPMRPLSEDPVLRAAHMARLNRLYSRETFSQRLGEHLFTQVHEYIHQLNREIQSPLASEDEKDSFKEKIGLLAEIKSLIIIAFNLDPPEEGPTFEAESDE